MSASLYARPYRGELTDEPCDSCDGTGKACCYACNSKIKCTYCKGTKKSAKGEMALEYSLRDLIHKEYNNGNYFNGWVKVDISRDWLRGVADVGLATASELLNLLDDSENGLEFRTNW